MSEARFIRIKTPLGEELKLLSFSGREELSQLFQIEVELESTNYNVDYEQIIGRTVTIELDTSRAGTRYFHGYVGRFVQMAPQRKKARYQATVVPWLWLLTRNSDCRIYQDMTVPEIVEDVFHRHGFSDFEWRLANRSQYKAWEYCVQYRETDFNFVSRMLEQEGIYYTFKHEATCHTLVLCDGASSHEPFPGYESVIYRPSSEGSSDAGYISDWRVSREIQPGAYEHTDFDFLEPRKDLLASSKAPNPPPHEPAGIFDYPGEYEQPDEATAWAKVRLQELQARSQIAEGTSDVRGLAAGATFQLKEHYRSDQNRKHLLVSVRHMAHGGSYDADASGEELPPTYQCSFRVMDAEVNFRAPRTTPKPLIQGVQTAVVVGPPGEEIHTDEHARVKVQFHWDRYGQRDENSSCFIRVSQSNAGAGWGSMITPRIGQEVIVEFLEGDPDRPIIIGRVYNGDNAPPYAGGQGVVSGLKSQTHKGSGSNEMSMNDTAGKEKVTIHSQYDMGTTVEHDQSDTVHNDRTISIDGKHTETIKKDTSIKVTEGKLDHYVKGNVTEQCDAMRVSQAKSTIHLISETADIWIKAATPVKVDSNGVSTGTFKEDGNIVIDGASSITLQSGASSIKLSQDGTILISGKKVTVSGTDESSMGVGNQNVTCDKQQVATSGAAISSSAVGKHEISGAVVKLN